MPSFVSPHHASHFSLIRSARYSLSNTAHNFNVIPTPPKLEVELIRSIDTSEFLTANKKLEPIRLALKQLDEVKDDWNSYGAPAPSNRAINMAWRVMAHLREDALIPERVLPSAEGGVAFIFTSATENRAVIENLNDGEDFVLLYDRQGNSNTLSWTGEIPKSLIVSLRTHLRGSRLAASR